MAREARRSTGQFDLTPGRGPPTTACGTGPSAADAAATSGKGKRLSPEWKLPKPWGDWALSEFPRWDAEKVRLEAERFRDHWCAKTGKDATKADWLATWRNWCRSPIAQRQEPTRALHDPIAAEEERDKTNAAANQEVLRLLRDGVIKKASEVINAQD